MNFLQKTLSYIRLDLSQSTRLFIDGAHWLTDAPTNEGYHVRSEANPHVWDFFTHKKIYEDLKTGDASVDFDYHSKEQTRLRKVFGDKKLNEFSPKFVALALFKEKMIHLIEEAVKLRGEPLTRSDLKNELAKATIEINTQAVKAASSSNYSNVVVEVKTFKVPTDKTFLNYWAEYNLCGRDPRSLIPRHHGPGRRKLSDIDSESLAIWIRFAHGYASSRQPTMKKQLDDCVAHIDKLNETRKRDDKLTPPKRKRFENIIRAMDQFQVMAAREGFAKARADYRAQLTGFDLVRPGERIEFDSQLFEIQTWLRAEEIWQLLSAESRKQLLRKRIYLLMGRDAATGYIVAAKGFLKDTSEAVVETLDMALSDKTHIARAVGSESDWYGGVVFQNAYTDNGGPYISEKTHAAFRAAGVNLTHPPAGQPWHRGFIESVFALISGHLLQYFDGRTFSDVGAKGDYDAVANATLTADEAIALLIRAILDIYHNKINVRTGETPHNAWVKYLQDTGVRYDVDPHKRRHVFGIPQKRKIHADGMYVWGIRFQSAELQTWRKKLGSSHQFEVRSHKADVRWISVLTPDGWITVPNRIKLEEQLSLNEWTVAVLRVKADSTASQEPFLKRIANAINDIRSSGEAAALRANISPHAPTNAEMLSRQAMLFEGMKISAPDEEAIALEPVQLGDDPLRDGGIKAIKLEAAVEQNEDPIDEQPLPEEPDNTEDDDNEDDQFA